MMLVFVSRLLRAPVAPASVPYLVLATLTDPEEKKNPA
jgi:hypothetical protein